MHLLKYSEQLNIYFLRDNLHHGAYVPHVHSVYQLVTSNIFIILVAKTRNQKYKYKFSNYWDN